MRLLVVDHIRGTHVALRGALVRVFMNRVLLHLSILLTELLLLLILEQASELQRVLKHDTWVVPAVLVPQRR